MSTLIVFLTLLFPPFGLPMSLYGIYKDNVNWRKYAFCFALAVASVAYAYIPTGEPDLVRYIEQFKLFGSMPFDKAVTYIGAGALQRGQGLYVLNAFYWLIGTIGDYHLAPMMTVFCIYYVGAYITCKIGEDMFVDRKYIIFYLIFMIIALNFLAIVNNIRNIFAFSLISLAIFRDCYQQKRNLTTITLYIVPVFFHISAVLFLGIRILMILPARWRNICALWMMGVSVISSFVYAKLTDILVSNNIFIQMLTVFLMKSNSYFTDDDSAWGLKVASDSYQHILKVLYITSAVIFLIVGILDMYKVNNERFGNNRRLQYPYIYALFASVLTIACSRMLIPVYWRFSSVVMLCSGVVFFTVMQKPSNVLYRVLIYFSFILSLLCSLLWMKRMLGGCKILSLLCVPFTASPISIFIIDTIEFVTNCF